MRAGELCEPWHDLFADALDNCSRIGAQRNDLHVLHPELGVARAAADELIDVDEIATVADLLANVTKKRNVVFVISDGYGPSFAQCSASTPGLCMISSGKVAKRLFASA